MRYALLALLFIVFAGRMTLTYRVFNDTADESTHITAGLELLQDGAYTVEMQHPPVARLAVAALPYYFGPMHLGSAPGNIWGSAWRHGDTDYYWRTLALARAGNLIFSLILFFFVYRWSADLYGAWAGVAACFLATCCPNLLAHGALATLDMATAATVLMAAYFFWRWSQQPGLRRALAAAAAFSLAILCKFSALFFLPPIATLCALLAWRRWTWRAAGASVLAFCLMVPLALHAVYPLPGRVPTGHRDTAQRPIQIVPSGFTDGVREVLEHNAKGHPGYALGKFSGHGWWYYFPLTVCLKSTLPMLLLAVLGISRPALYPLLSAAVVFAVAMPSNLNIGVRHVLAVYPFLAIAGAGAFARRGKALLAAAVALLAWHVAESVAAHPDYLAYFNQIARGREEQFLLDSNLDWGQDLARLAEFVRRNRIDEIQLAYFGVTWPAKLGLPARQLSPHGPQPGWGAISVNHLMGLTVPEANYAWLRGRKPIARVGKSILVYHF